MIGTVDLGGRLAALRRTLQRRVRKRAAERDLICERLVYETLMQDPSGIFAEMDWETRVRYYQAVECHAHRSGLAPPVVAARALAAAQDAALDLVKHPGQTHVGYYLIGTGASDFRRALHGGRGTRTTLSFARVSWSRLAYRGLILLSILAQVALVSYLAHSSASVSILVLCCLVLSGLPIFHIHAVNVVQAVLRPLFPLRLLPKLQFDGGIPDTARTFVVVPTVLASKRQAHDQVMRLADLAELNPDPNLRFALLSDFADSDDRIAEGDEEILRTLANATNELNHRHRDGQGDRFFVLHRERSWTPGESTWMGWERKRGKLQELNRALRGTSPGHHFRWVFGDFETYVASHAVKYVFTLDDTTCLEKGEATQLIRTAAHPLNRAVFDSTTTRIIEGYGIFQPTIVPALSATPSRRKALRVGDLTVPGRTMRGLRNGFGFDAFGEGAFAGKALYDVDAFRACLEDVLPLNAVLSHDRLEGWHVRTAEVCDSFIVEAIPARYLTAYRQRHRWSRGDTQLARWLLPRIRDAGDHPRPNRLSAAGRLAVVDLLLRTLFGPARLSFLVLCWIFVPTSVYLWPAIAFATMIYPILRSGLTLILRHLSHLATGRARADESADRSRAQFANLLVAFALCVALLALESLIMIAAITCSLWRMVVSHKKLLQWTPQQEVERTVRGALSAYWQIGWASTALAIGLLVSIPLRNPSQMPVAIPIAGIWSVAFVICWFLDQPPRSVE